MYKGVSYTLSLWRSYLGSVRVELLHQETARNITDPFTAHVSEEVIQVSRMTKVHHKFLEKSPGCRGSRLFAPETC